jgi:hypothetical protein
VFTKDPDAQGRIDSVALVKGTFEVLPDLSQPKLEIEFRYYDCTKADHLGKIVVNNSVFSPETLEAFLLFLQKAEEDWGRNVFREGITTALGSNPQILGFNQAESPHGLKIGG